MISGKHENKEVYWYEMSLLNIHAFISFYNGSFACLILKHNDFFLIRVIINIVGTNILLRINVYCVFLGSMLNRIFVLVEMLSQAYLEHCQT